MFYVFLLFCLILITFYLYQSTVKPRNYPPGPNWLPLIGCSSVLSTLYAKHGSQCEAFAQLAKEYSTKILGLKVGKEHLIIVYGEENIKDVMGREEFDGRPDSYFMRLRCLGKRLGITGVDGPLWREHRMFTVKQLKMAGFGRQVMETKIKEETKEIVSYILKHLVDVNLKSILASSIMNVLWNFVAGQSLKDDPRLYRLLDLLSKRSKAFTMSGGWLNSFPWLRFIFPELSGYELISQINEELSKIIIEAIEKNQKKMTMHQDEKVEENFIIAFLTEMEKGKSTYTVEQLTVTCLDLFIAGSQTTGNSLEFAFLTVLQYEIIQDRLYEEIKATIGEEVPSWKDRERMPYTMAFLMEIQRYFTIVPLIGPRRTLKETEVAGYNFPKESTVLLGLRQACYDPMTWDDPHSFNPERFLSSDGTFRNTEHLFNFGLGRRRCPGDDLAKQFIFITFVTVLQNFKILRSGSIHPSLIPDLGIVASPKPYSVCFVKRS